VLIRHTDVAKSGVVGWFNMAFHRLSARIDGRSDRSRAVVSARCIVRCPLLAVFADDRLKGNSVIASPAIASLENAWARERFRLAQSIIRGATIAHASGSAGNDAATFMQNPDRGSAQRLSEIFAMLSTAPQRTGEQSRAAYAAVAEVKSSVYRDRDYGSKR